MKQLARRVVGRFRSPQMPDIGALFGPPLVRNERGLVGLGSSKRHWSTPNAFALRRARPRKIYGQIGGLEVRLAETTADIRRAQRLRYRVFYVEMAAKASITAQMRQRDEDPYDAVCDHLLVTDTAKTMNATNPWSNGRKPKVVGTYRLLRQEAAERGRGFYTQGEFDIAPLIAAQPKGTRFLELGRSCVLEPYRTKRTVELLWHGLWTYVRENKVDVMIGCASFEGTDPAAHAMALSLLYHQSLAPPEWRCRAHDRLYQRMDLIPKDQLDLKAALKKIPPLIKGYMRLGAYVGDGAVIDHQFGTTDVLIVLPVSKINPRYFGHFGAPDELKSRVAVEH
jgi:L-ornithine Nalpha-acyltransferase